MKISVICVYNNRAQLDEQLVASIKAQNVECEFIPLDNRDNIFPSAAKALNHGASLAQGDILIFSHQDIFFKTESELKELAEAIQQCEVGTIVGTAGVKEPSKFYYMNLTSTMIYNPELQDILPKQLYNVSTVDECLFGMKRATWEAHPFNEVLCDNWHLYAVEACLWARQHDHSVYVYPSQVHHFSWGHISLGYMMNLKELCKTYRKDFKYIWTTCYKVRTNSIYINTLVALWVTQRFLRGKLK